MDKMSEKFKTLAEKRVNRALKEIQLIGNLANTNNYKYTPEDVQKIHSALKKSIDTMKSKFDSYIQSKNEEFKF